MAVRTLIVLLMMVIVSCVTQTTEENRSITKEFIDQQNGYSQAVVVSDGFTNTIYVSGQIGEGENFGQQMRSAIKNLQEVLGKAGATFDDVVKINTYIVNYSPELLDEFRNIRKEVLGDTEMPASTLVGVEALGKEEWLIEIEAVAIIRD